jgi:hypothetical protein
MEGHDLDRLQLPQMITSAENDESMYTAFAVTVDLRVGTSTGARDVCSPGFHVGVTHAMARMIAWFVCRQREYCVCVVWGGRLVLNT